MKFLTYTAAGDIPPYSFVEPSGNDNEVKVANGASTLITGVSNDVYVHSGNVVDVKHFGCTKIRLGGSVKEGEALTSDENGGAVKANDGDNIAAIALDSGAKDEVIYAVVALSRSLKTTVNDTTEENGGQ